jgi:DNA-directed RNA polymerase subunit RPC12/RpoP
MSDVLDYKCPSCDGAIKFDSTSQKMKCPYCGNVFDVDTIREYNERRQKIKDTGNQPQATWKEYDKNSGNGDWTKGEKINYYVCQNCGGELMTDPQTVASACPYCGSPVVLTDRVEGSLKPDFVIPFKYDKDTAKEKLKEFIKGKFLLPGSFKTENHLDSIKGIYVPFWLFDCNVDADMTFKTTRHTHWSDSKYDYVKTDYFSVWRKGKVGFDKVPVDGSSRMQDEYMEAMEPFNYTQLVNFGTEYLAGYAADKYDVDAKQCEPRADARIKTSTIAAFRDTVQGYDSCITDRCQIDLHPGEVHYALLPVWMLGSTYRGKQYMFAMNGQTGKFIGNLPVDMVKFFLLLITIFVGVSAIGILILKLMGMI